MLDSNSCYIIKDVSLNEPNIIYPIGYEEGQLFVIEPSDTTKSGFAPFSYQWYNSNGAIIGANDSCMNQMHQITISYQFLIMVVVENLVFLMWKYLIFQIFYILK